MVIISIVFMWFKYYLLHSCGIVSHMATTSDKGVFWVIYWFSSEIQEDGLYLLTSALCMSGRFR